MSQTDTDHVDAAAARARADLDAVLPAQLGRLSDGWGGRPGRNSPLDDLLVELGTALVRAGHQLHDCVLPSSEGGVCLTPSPARNGVIVTWSCHHVLPHERYSQYRSVLEVMNFALADLLAEMSFDVRELGAGSAALVVGRTATTPHEEAEKE